MAEPRAGDTFDGWELLEWRGAGANAWVFIARRDDQTVALKILKSRKVDSEPYQRFRRETEVLERIGNRPGVVPMLESSLPADLSQNDRAWFSMPIAEPLADALVEVGLSVIVADVARIARTLAELREEYEISHRDLKPENLYRYEGVAAVGDFGLVAVPDEERLTLPGKKIGPANFIPYEMLVDAENADAGPADVYSLAKTLWVLATNQRWPPPGHQPVGESPSIGAFRPHPRAAELDALVDRATRHAPEARPTMDEFAGELDAWLALPAPSQPLLDLAALGAELKRATEGQTADADARDRLQRAAYSLMERLETRLEDVGRILDDALPNSGSDGGPLINMLGSSPGMGVPQIESRYFVGRTFTGVEEVLPNKFRYGGIVELYDDGTVLVRTGLYIGNDHESGASAWLSDPRSCPVESVTAGALIDDAADELIALVPEWARRFVGQS
jgi:hypothetical protein